MPSQRSTAASAVPADLAAASTIGNALSLDEQLCFTIYSTMLSLNKVYRGVLRDLDLTYLQYLAMLVLWERDGLNVSDICARLSLETTTLTPLLKRLESRGLIQRVRLERDERQVIVSLTKAGRALRTRAQNVPGCIAGAMELSPPQIAALRTQLLGLRSALDKNA